MTLILTALFSLIFIKKEFHILFKLPTFQELKTYYIEGYHLFLSTIVVNLYTTSNSLILGFMVGYESVGIYSLAERIYSAITKVIIIVNQVLYPYLARFSHDMKSLIYKMRYILKYYILFLSIISMSLFFTSEIIIELLFGYNHQSSILVLKILSITLLFRPYGALFTQFMIIKSRQKDVSRVTFLTMIFNFITVFPMIYLYKELGLAISLILVAIYHLYINLQHNLELLKCTQ
jgi:PST family polysaccharide transporter